MNEDAITADLKSEVECSLEKRSAEVASSGSTGNETALQLLPLPQRKPLPRYNKEATCLASSHCRLCLHLFPHRQLVVQEIVVAADDSDAEATGSRLREEAGEKEVLAHLATHGLHPMEDYRKEVFCRVVGSPLDTITKQVLCSRLYACKRAKV